MISRARCRVRQFWKRVGGAIAGTAVIVGGVWGVSILRPLEVSLVPSQLAAQEATAARTHNVSSSSDSTVRTPPSAPQPVRYLTPPEKVRAVYMSQCVVGTPALREKLVALVRGTELNALVIDVKDYTGAIGFPTTHPLLREAAMQGCGARDLRKFLARLKEEGIYTIARITVFQDPFYAARHPDQAVQRASEPGTIWRDRKGIAFVDVSARPFWDYILAIAREARAIGFDELNFDYVRFPTDGDIDDMVFPWTKDTPKAEALERFFAFLSRELRERDHIPLSVDLFGMTTVARDDLNIGQVWERAAPYFDYLAPMVYPSHYPPGFLGLQNPNDDPYAVVYHAITSGVARLAATTTPVRTLAQEERVYRTEFVPPSASSTATTTRRVWTGLYRKRAYPATTVRPWLQDFDYGGTYSAAEVRAQIKATYDAGVRSWMLWSPSNRYTRDALLPAATR